MADATNTPPPVKTDIGGPVEYEVATLPVLHRSWVPLAVAAGLAGLAYLLLNVPGVLRYPAPVPRPDVAQNDPNAAQRRAALDEHNRSLREQIEQAKRLAGRNVCVRDGELMEQPQQGDPPPGQSRTDAPGAGTRTGPQVARAEPQPVSPADGGNLLPRAPEATPVPPGTVPNFEGRMTDLLDKATVLVIAQPSGMGTGFFISPRHIVTNRHVADASPTGKFYVTNKLLAGLKVARLVAKSEPGPTGGPDFAVLEIDAPQPAPPIMPLSSSVGRLQRVTAAGFPGIGTASDQKMEALKRGDPTAIPDLVLTQGTVTVVQNRESGNPIVGHEANISPGNSGGPLVDECAHVVGVNTYGIFDESGKHHVNYALGAASLATFLKAKNIPFQANDAACQSGAPQTATAAPAAAPGGPAAAGPVTPAAAGGAADPARPPVAIPRGVQIPK